MGINHPKSYTVMCENTGIIYGSFLEAERETGVNEASISRCCNGKQKTAGKHPVTGEKLTWVKLENNIN